MRVVAAADEVVGWVERRVVGAWLGQLYQMMSLKQVGARGKMLARASSDMGISQTDASSDMASSLAGRSSDMVA